MKLMKASLGVSCAKIMHSSQKTNIMGKKVVDEGYYNNE